MSRLPESIGKYKITERLERGGMSLLYKAEHPTLGRPVVLKKLMLKGGAEHRNRFRREASLMMELRHENVVGVFDHFQEGSGRYLVMEYVEGSSLAELLSREGALTPAEVQWLTGRIALALSHIHSRGVVHRDVKPSNVLLGKDGSVKLGDFGIAFEPGETEELTSSGTTLGTPGFMAPEQLEDARSADERSDIWSLGVCCFELITGRKFITGPTPAAIRKALPGAVRGYRQRLPERLPRSLQRFLRKTLVMNAASRLPDGQAAADLLKAVPGTPPPEELMLRLEKLMGGPVAKRPVKAAQP
ncbi:MAG: serine/threonine protein kinase, partial [Spirochaetales bacterium]